MPLHGRFIPASAFADLAARAFAQSRPTEDRPMGVRLLDGPLAPRFRGERVYVPRSMHRHGASLGWSLRPFGQPLLAMHRVDAHRRGLVFEGITAPGADITSGTRHGHSIGA